jgi:hypothetical protein
VNNVGFASLFVRTNDGYVMGFWTPSRNSGSFAGVLGFSDMYQQLEAIHTAAGRGAVQVGDLGFRSNYMALGSDVRGDVGMGPAGIGNAIRVLQAYDSRTTATAQAGLRACLIVLIQATMEAARFQYISDQVLRNIRTNSNDALITYSLQLENAWTQMSAWIHNGWNNPPNLALFRVGNNFFQNPRQLLGTIGYVLSAGSV